MMSKKTYHHGDLRRALIDAALEIVAEKDVNSVSLREVARRVGVSHTSPYRHFADKDALLAALATEGFEMLSKVLKETVEDTNPNPLKQVEATGIAYVRYAIEHPSHYRVMFGAYEAACKEKYPTLAEAGEQTFMVLVDAIIEGQNAGLIRSGEPQQLAQAAWALVHGLAMLLIDGLIPIKETDAIASLSSAVTGTLIEGLAKKT
jgi:AcrR family transcriptional regulator